jgi:hypothetical protein
MMKGWPARKADNLTAICEPTVENVGASTSHNLTGLHGLLQGLLLPFLFYHHYNHMTNYNYSSVFLIIPNNLDSFHIVIFQFPKELP